MRFMFFITSAHTSPPTPELIEAMDKLANEEIKAGRMIDTGGLMPLVTGARVTLKQGKVALIDGPFIEAKEMVGGYAIFEMQNKEEAVASAMNFMQLHADHMPGWEGTCEVRAMAGEDFEAGCPVSVATAADA
ncbi:MAG: hypothetical protein C0481_13180 [Phenylobacterium sp.]|uniref:YciI family protein n=1 Tax=Phenylobacterium sp. TaxID=1871053 RepID=UPI0025E58FDC|nr:YciI family protein [Phenylobacterium sp.]MBA4012813.1 hypothetical protein [Phenylobacterium sp.]